jgi:hypothetical protein
MGFFKCVNQGFGKAPGEAIGNCNYIPITYISLNELRKNAADNLQPIPEYIEKAFHPLAAVLSRNNSKVINTFLFAIREMIRNIEEHSNAPGVWFVGQYWPSYELVEIAILDEGIGIYKSLMDSGYYRFNDTEEALLMSLQPGISRSFKGKQKGRSIYENSGYGLFMTSQICSNGGSFSICSSGNALIIKDSKTVIKKVAFCGTAIQLQLREKELLKIPNILIEISKKGSALSRKYDGFKIPSKSSLLESLT